MSAQTEWTTIPTPILRTYRFAYRLRVPTAYSYPHAELTYKSNEAALRAPSVVFHRRKLHEQHMLRKRAREEAQTTTNSSKSRTKSSKEKVKAKEPSDSTGHASADAQQESIAQSIEHSDPDLQSTKSHLRPPSPSSSSNTSTTYLGPRIPATNLASAVRKHFNAQQVVGTEGDTIARFIYVVQQNGSSKQVWTEGSEGDGTGFWMGSNGREVKKVDGPGGEVGFRLRFRP
jgi:hypothetical protein